MVGTAAADGDDDALLTVAAAAEAPSEHPLARAIVAAARQRNGGIPASEDFRALPGRGVEARIDETTVAVGGPALLRELGVQSPPQLDRPVDGWRARGAAVLHVVRDGQVTGALALEDQVRPDAIRRRRYGRHPYAATHQGLIGAEGLPQLEAGR